MFAGHITETGNCVRKRLPYLILLSLFCAISLNERNNFEYIIFYRK